MKQIGKAVFAVTLMVAASTAFAQESAPQPGTPEAAVAAVVQLSSVLAGVDKSQVKAELKAADEGTADVIAQVPSPNLFDRVCRYWLVKSPNQNQFGWEVKNQACTQG